MARWLRARVYAPHLAVLNGPGVGAILVEVTGRPPRWSRSLRGWAVQEKTAADVIAEADRQSYRVEIVDYRADTLVDVSPREPRPALRNPLAAEPAELELDLSDSR